MSMPSSKKIKLKDSVLVKKGKRKTMVYNASADTILEFSNDMAKLMAFLDKHLLKNSSVTLKEIQKGLAKSSKRKKIPEESIVDAVELLAKLSLLEGRKGSNREQRSEKRDSTNKPSKRTFSIRGMGKVVILGGAAVLLAVGGAQEANAWCGVGWKQWHDPAGTQGCKYSIPFSCGPYITTARPAYPGYYSSGLSYQKCCDNAGCS